MRKNIFKILSLAALLSVAVFLFFLNEITISIRMNELKTYLQDLDFNEGSIDHISLIATYEVNKKIYENRITQDIADSIEYKISSLQINQASEESENKYEILYFPALYIINFNRKILGKPAVRYYRDKDDYYNDLDQAYYYERNYLFKKAVSFYDRVLERKNLNSSVRASILLRKGYCYALSGFDDNAQDNYRMVISEYGHEGSAVTATVLLSYLKGFSQARERVLSDDADSLVKSRKLVSLLAYEKALDVLNKASRNAPAGDIAQIEYLKARSYRGMGNNEKAVESLLKVITSNPDSVYARHSNRQLYIIGTNMGGANKIKEISKDINLKLKDPVLEDMYENQDEPDSFAGMGVDTINIVIPEHIKNSIKNLKVKDDEVKNTFVTITTKDGNRFIGNLLGQDSNKISIQTSIGIIDVKRETIIEVLENK